jgi:glycosyltransferase involved in cell wall biosynthesis
MGPLAGPGLAGALGVTLKGRKVVYLVSEDWYFCSHRLPLGIAAREAGAEVVVATRVNDHRTQIEAAGLRIAPIEMQRSGANPFTDLATIRQITKLYRHEKPDLVHHVALKPILYGGYAAKRAGVPAIVNAVAGMGFIFISNSRFARTARPLIARAQRALMNRANTRTILQNPDDVEMYTQRIGVSPNRLTIIPGAGVDIDQFTVVPEPFSVPTAVCVSRMLRDKGIHELVAATRLLHAKGVELRVRLVGPTDDNPASIPHATLAEWNREGVVEVVGPSEDIAGEYARAHIAVLPSYREGLPKSLLEAAACGRPMVATDVPGCREICIDGETGLRVPAHTIEPLADALERLVLDPALRQRLGENARCRAETIFAEKIINAQTLALYEEMLAR